MRTRSLPRRLDRLSGRRHAGDRERLVHDRRFGPCTSEEFVRRCAAEFDLPEEELRAELARASRAVGLPAETAR